jgi:hypothetical protein
MASRGSCARQQPSSGRRSLRIAPHYDGDNSLQWAKCFSSRGVSSCPTMIMISIHLVGLTPENAGRRRVCKALILPLSSSISEAALNLGKNVGEMLMDTKLLISPATSGSLYLDSIAMAVARTGRVRRNITRMIRYIVIGKTVPTQMIPANFC